MAKGRAQEYRTITRHHEQNEWHTTLDGHAQVASPLGRTAEQPIGRTNNLSKGTSKMRNQLVELGRKIKRSIGEIHDDEAILSEARTILTGLKEYEIRAYHADELNQLENATLCVTDGLYTQFQANHERRYIDLAIQYEAVTIELLAGHNVVQPSLLNNHGFAYEARFEYWGGAGNVKDLGMVIKYHTDAAVLIPKNHPVAPSILNNLGVSLCMSSTS
ncbi:hypothetical protein B0J17DRAFT_633096 [Rhizoctonia solani]|nr:hypothetical protein B0J17DRAFT_633096 [Rhizoctonia solani]